MAESSQKLLVCESPSPFSGMVWAMVSHILPVSWEAPWGPHPHHPTWSGPFLPVCFCACSCRCVISVFAYMSLLPDQVYVWQKHVLFGAVSSGPISLPGCGDTRNVCRRKKGETWGGGTETEGKREGRKLETTPSCDHYCLGQLMLWDIQAYAKTKLVFPQKFLNFKKLK